MARYAEYFCFGFEIYRKLLQFSETMYGITCTLYTYTTNKNKHYI